MTTAAHRPRAGHRAARTEQITPVLAGALAGVGVGCVEVAWGPLTMFVTAACSWAFITLLLFSALSEQGYDFGWSLHMGLIATVIAVGLLGLTLVSPIVGGMAATLGVLKLATSRLPSRRRRRVLRTRRESAVVRPDQWKVDREFARLVAELEEDQS